MNIFIDTSALYAIMDGDDENHQHAKNRWTEGLEQNNTFVCHNYIIAETITLLQNRIGIDCVRALIESVLPVLSITWVDQQLHSTGLSSLLAASQRGLSFVDCISFTSMLNQGITHTLAFDRHFQEQGFISL